MKLRLLNYLRCPICRGTFRLDEADVPPGVGDVTTGWLECVGCQREYPVREGVPRLLAPDHALPDDTRTPTARNFGYLWAQSDATATETSPAYHFEKMAQSLGLPPTAGLVLDAGCGEGIDLVNQARHGDVEVIGVELSEGGCRTTFARIAGLSRAHVVQADLRQLPFADSTFDRIYSYGVLHHIASPPAAAAELARVAVPGGDVSVYLYEDFGERALAWRVALTAANALRAMTTRLPPWLLYRLSQLASPFVYLTFTVPYRFLTRMPWTRNAAAALPFRHGKGPFRLTGDLYDRFSAPVEFRYSRHRARDLLSNAGLHVTAVAYERGWMVAARRGGN